jgi:hypothetical protein
MASPEGFRFQCPILCSRCTVGFCDYVYSLLPLGSQVLRWNGTLFIPLENLTTPFGTLLEPNTFPSAPSVLGKLRGVTDFEPFTAADGEHYLAIAMSVCDYRSAGSAACVAVAAQPRSAVLQWDRSAGIFGELLAVTDKTNQRLRGTPIPDDMLRHHQVLIIAIPVSISNK